MITFPEPPPDPDGRAHGPVPLRFEDVTQDGRVMLEALPNGLGESVFGGLYRDHPITNAFRAQGIIPILARMVMVGTPGPIAVHPAPTARGAYRFAHTVSAADVVERLVLNLWSELSAPRGRTYDPQPEGAGEIIRAGRVFTESVFTRPFAPPEERKVLRFDVPGLAPVPGAGYRTRANEAILALPDDAEVLDPALALDPAPVVFGIGQTDSNQHINSLVYPRLFEEAALRRFAALGESAACVPRALEIGFRKPCFAGETVRVALRAYRRGDALGAVGVFVSQADAASDAALARARPHTFVHMVFER